MPIYEFKCLDCGYKTEVFKHSDNTIIPICEKCKKEMSRIYNSVPFIKKPTIKQVRSGDMKDSQFIEPFNN
jgi:putative FmdB family regulatory protein